MLKIFVVGGFDEDKPSDSLSIGMHKFGSALGAEMARQGHVLVSGCRSDLGVVPLERRDS